MTEDSGRASEDRDRRSEVGGRRTDDGGPRTEDREMRPVKHCGGGRQRGHPLGEGRVGGFGEKYHVESWHSG